MVEIINWANATQQQRAYILGRCPKTETGDDNVTARVMEIMHNVKTNGDTAVVQYNAQFSQYHGALQLQDAEWDGANQCPKPLQLAIDGAYKRIYEYHHRQITTTPKYDNDGITLWRVARPIDRVGLYIPAGTAPLVSTLLMLAIPAQLAGVKNIIMVTPVGADGIINNAILYTAKLCNITQIFKTGGAHGVSAMGYGTQTIPKVDKIFGPGNKYVTRAKQLLANDPAGAALDMPAGPSEVLIITDETANPAFTAADMLAQCEHDTDSQAIVISTSMAFLNQVNDELEKQAKTLSRYNILQESLQKSRAILVENLTMALHISNQYAPEHLLVQCEYDDQFLANITNAGSVFLGNWSAEALGDYASGPNHVLPTFGYAKQYSGVGVESFQKYISFQAVSPGGFANIQGIVRQLAQCEGLTAHEHSVALRNNIYQKGQ